MTWRRLDEDLLAAVRAGTRAAVWTWEPPEPVVVLGRSNDPEREVCLEACQRDGVPVLRRRGGGGAVLLAPGCLVVTLAYRVDEPLAVGRHLREAVERTRRALRRATGVAAEPRGTGDLCLGDRKILGSSAFSGRGGFLYQASLLVAPELGLVERYLRHPSREPPYRRGRPHRAFLTSLQEAGHSWEVRTLGSRLERELVVELGHTVGGPVVTPNVGGV